MLYILKLNKNRIYRISGTGKTHVLVFIIGHLLGIRESNNRRKILYCAPTNAAVDEMIRRLLNYCGSRRREDQFSGKI